jgi:hypothetical protein
VDNPGELSVGMEALTRLVASTTTTPKTKGGNQKSVAIQPARDSDASSTPQQTSHNSAQYSAHNSASDGRESRRVSTCHLELDSRESSFCGDEEYEEYEDEEDETGVEYKDSRRHGRRHDLELSSRATSIAADDESDESVDTDQSALLDNVQLFDEFKLSLVHLYGNKAKEFFEKETEYMLAKLDDVMLMGLTNIITKDIDMKIREYVFDENGLIDVGGKLPTPSALVRKLNDEEEAEITRLSQNSIWHMASKDWVTARRDALVASKTYEETLKATAFERQKGFLFEQQLVEEVKLKDKEFVLIYRCEQNTGLIGSEALTRARRSLESAEEKLATARRDNTKFLHDSLELETMLGKLKIQKENIYHKLMLTNEERDIAEIKEECQDLRRAAYVADKLVTILHDNAKQSPDNEAIILWDDVILKTKDAEFSWFRTMNSYQSGLAKVASNAKDWWERAIETSKNAVYVKRIAVTWYEARKAECMARLAEAAVSRIESDVVVSTELWDDALAKAGAVALLWSNAADGGRSCRDVVHEVFQDWWDEKVVAAEELKAVWGEFHNLLIDTRCNDSLDIDSKAEGASSAVLKPDDSGVSAAVEKALGSPAAKVYMKNTAKQDLSGSSSSEEGCLSTASRVESLKARISYNTVDLEDSMESSRRKTAQKPLFSLNIFNQSPKPSPKKEEVCPFTRAQQTQMEDLRVQSLALEAEGERKRLRSAQQGVMTPAMSARQEETIRICFENANMAKAKLLYNWKEPKGVTLLPGIWLSRIASTVSVNKSAERNYAAAVRREAVEDSKKDPRIAVQLKEDWRRRIQADRNVVMRCRQIKEEANSSKDVTFRIRTQRDHVRAKAILEGDLAAYNAAWPSEATEQAI